ncbi:MAG TPA: BamA/TamA family outer membrane protein [Myxococcales bacterium]|nr:BamA/TamA family outer membrane protein [Myxococcales bacterium]
MRANRTRAWAAAAAVATALAALPSGPARADEESARDHGWDAIALPVLSYSTDLGLGFGAVGGAYVYGPGYRPYRHAVGAQTYFNTKGGQSHFIRYDGPDLIGPIRLEAQVELRRELHTPYYGSGNLSVPGLDAGDVWNQFSYERRAPRAWVRLRAHPFGRDHPLQLWAGYMLRAVEVRPYQGSLLAQAPPPGLPGGLAGQASAGALRDTRDDEANPTRGSVEEVAVRASGRATLSDYAFAGFMVSERRYLSLGSPALVLAGRAVLDHQVGNVPFFEWPQVGGIAVAEGIGGMTSVRGVPRDRFAGNTKAFANLELRWLPLSFLLRGQRTHLGGVAFADAGRVWQPEVDDGPWYAWHPGTGVGLRAVRRAAVLRADWAISPETLRSSLYLTVGQMF